MNATAMNTTHTPGPWSVHGTLIRDSDDFPIADVYGRQCDPIHQANARLIAAAPDLLVVLQMIVSGYEASPLPGMETDIGAARDAIAKAEGREP